MTDEEKASPPTDEWAKEVCKIGQGAACCRFLTMSPDGWSCQKHGVHSAHLTFRALVLEEMTAVSDNCDGRAA